MLAAYVSSLPYCRPQLLVREFVTHVPAQLLNIDVGVRSPVHVYRAVAVVRPPRAVPEGANSLLVVPALIESLHHIIKFLLLICSDDTFQHLPHLRPFLRLPEF